MQDHSHEKPQVVKIVEARVYYLSNAHHQGLLCRLNELT